MTIFISTQEVKEAFIKKSSPINVELNKIFLR